MLLRVSFTMSPGAWYYMGTVTDPDGPADSWVADFRMHFYPSGPVEDWASFPVVNKYVASVYWAITTLTTVSVQSCCDLVLPCSA